MSEKKGIVEKAKGEMRLTERILAALPGFRGYKEKEIRRESDRLIRNHLYQRLTQARGDLKESFQTLSDRNVQEVLSDMDRLIMRFDRVSEKINHASYGYAGFFNIVKIEEEKLDKMIGFDTGLIDEVDNIVEESGTFRKEVAREDFQNARNHITNVNDMLAALEDTFEQRHEVIEGAM
jgi:hypothetical protein